MGTRALTVELPDDLIDLLGTPADAAAKAREALVLELLRDGAIGQGRAARLLGLNRWELLDRMARSGVPSGPETAEEMRRDIAVARQACGHR